MHKIRYLTYIFIIFCLIFTVIASCLILIMRFGITERWDIEPTQEKDLPMLANTSANPTAESQYEALTEVIITPRMLKPLATMPPQESRSDTSEQMQDTFMSQEE